MSSIEARPTPNSTAFPALNNPISVWLSCNFRTFHLLYVIVLFVNIIISCVFFAYSISSMIDFYSKEWSFSESLFLTPLAAWFYVSLIYSLGAYALAAGSLFLVEGWNLMRFSPHVRPHFLHTAAAFVFAAISLTFGILTFSSRQSIGFRHQLPLLRLNWIFGIANVALLHALGLFITFLSFHNEPANADQLGDEENQLRESVQQQ